MYVYMLCMGKFPQLFWFEELKEFLNKESLKSVCFFFKDPFIQLNQQFMSIAIIHCNHYSFSTHFCESGNLNKNTA